MPIRTADPIWWGTPDLAWANGRGAGLLNGTLGIELLEAGSDFLSARMPVDDRTRQPAGVLHGGASVVLAETVASWAGAFVVDPARFHCVGMEINANHVRPASGGWVSATARPLALGRRTHVWDVRIVGEDDRLVCVSRCTLAVLETPSAY
ncbi:hotdog fold thioesterase [Nocardioides pacificus]